MNEYYRFIKSLYLDIPAPISVSINLTNNCNQHCIYCEIGQGLIKTEKPLINFQDLQWIIREMHTAKIPLLYLGGGEPLLFKEIIELIQYAHTYGIKCKLFTNGTLLDRLSQNQLDTLRKCATSVSVSIDSFSNEKEDFIKGLSGVLTQQIKGIEKILDNNITMNICTVISSYNYDGLFDLVKNIDKLGIHQIKFQPVIFISNFPESDTISNKKNLNINLDHIPKIKNQFELILKYEKKSKIRTNIPLLRRWLFDYIDSIYSNEPEYSTDKELFFKKVLHKFYCATIYSDIAINYYGQIMPCNMLGPRESIKDNKEESLLDLWNKSSDSLRKGIKNDFFPEECRSCVNACDGNLIYSTLKYPISNYHIIPYVLRAIIK